MNQEEGYSVIIQNIYGYGPNNLAQQYRGRGCDALVVHVGDLGPLIIDNLPALREALPNAPIVTFTSVPDSEQDSIERKALEHADAHITVVPGSDRILHLSTTFIRAIEDALLNH